MTKQIVWEERNDVLDLAEQEAVTEVYRQMKAWMKPGEETRRLTEHEISVAVIIARGMYRYLKDDGNEP